MVCINMLNIIKTTVWCGGSPPILLKFLRFRHQRCMTQPKKNKYMQLTSCTIHHWLALKGSLLILHFLLLHHILKCYFPWSHHFLIKWITSHRYMCTWWWLLLHVLSITMQPVLVCVHACKVLNNALIPSCMLVMLALNGILSVTSWKCSLMHLQVTSYT